MQSWRGSMFEPSGEFILVWFEKLRPSYGVVLPYSKRPADGSVVV